MLGLCQKRNELSTQKFHVCKLDHFRFKCVICSNTFVRLHFSIANEPHTCKSNSVLSSFVSNSGTCTIFIHYVEFLSTTKKDEKNKTKQKLTHYTEYLLCLTTDDIPDFTILNFFCSLRF